MTTDEPIIINCETKSIKPKNITLGENSLHSSKCSYTLNFVILSFLLEPINLLNTHNFSDIFIKKMIIFGREFVSTLELEFTPTFSVELWLSRVFFPVKSLLDGRVTTPFLPTAKFLLNSSASEAQTKPCRSFSCSNNAMMLTLNVWNLL